MEEETNLKIPFISYCTALVLLIESEEHKLSMTPTTVEFEGLWRNENYHLKYAIKRARY